MRQAACDDRNHRRRPRTGSATHIYHTSSIFLQQHGSMSSSIFAETHAAYRVRIDRTHVGSKACIDRQPVSRLIIDAAQPQSPPRRGIETSSLDLRQHRITHHQHFSNYSSDFAPDVFMAYDRLRAYANNKQTMQMPWTSYSAGNAAAPRLHMNATTSGRNPLAIMPRTDAWVVEQQSSQPDEVADLLYALSVSEEETSDDLDNIETYRGVGRSNKAPQQQPTSRGLLRFEKTWTYANSRLPPHMPPMLVYMPTWRLLCMAADASLSVYNKPRGAESEHYIKADWQNDTKAMILKTNPMDDQKVIVFAIRGSRMTFADWAVNFRPAPTPPTGFLDDDGNYCHAGFLTVAKAMVSVVAARLRQLLEQDPSRASSSLLITGHSAGGAIAALLYAHMHSESVESELTVLTGCFKRVHCVTFGAPPVTLLPLQKPNSVKRRKGVFMALVNEGDPIARAEKAYILSLGKLLASPANRPDDVRKQALSKKTSTLKLNLFKPPPKQAPAPYWDPPPATLSLAGKVIVMRRKPGSKSPAAIEAVQASDGQLRQVVFGDPSMHTMILYKQRIDQLATAAVTGNAIT